MIWRPNSAICITLRIEASSGHLSNDVSMPLALILNELLTNAAKHAGAHTVRVELWTKSRPPLRKNVEAEAERLAAFRHIPLSGVDFAD